MLILHRCSRTIHVECLILQPFELNVRWVGRQHGLLAVWGVVDLAAAQVVAQYLHTVRDQLEGGLPPQLASLEPGQADCRIVGGQY